MIVARNPADSGKSTSANNYNNNADEVQVGAGAISYLIVNICPTNCYFLDQTTQLGIVLNGIK